MIVVAFRRASPEAAEELTELTLASKAHWGYDQDFMALARPSLSVTAAYIEDNDCWVAEMNGAIVGWVQPRTCRRRPSPRQLLPAAGPHRVGRGTPDVG